MPDPAETITRATSNTANDRRRAAETYTNVMARPGNDPVLRRLLSETGFLTTAQFDTISPSARNFEYSRTEGSREIKQIIVVPFGYRNDIARLTSLERNHRLVTAADTPGTNGVRVAYGRPDYLMSGALTGDLYGAAKGANVTARATGIEGPAPHFIVNRRGDVVVVLSADAKAHVIPAYFENGIFIALETAVIIPRAAHAQRNFRDTLIEAEPSNVQRISLAVLVKKLLTFLGPTFPRTFTDDLPNTAQGFSYQRTAPQPNLQLENGTFTDIPNFFALVDLQPNFELTTDIWRSTTAPPPVAGREEVRASTGQLDTFGQSSAVMGRYVTLAAGSRSAEMQSRARRTIFADRRQSAYRHAEAADSSAAGVTAGLAATAVNTTAATNYEPNSYDFTTGLWGDNVAF
jgi:hypothetical protein